MPVEVTPGLCLQAHACPQALGCTVHQTLWVRGYGSSDWAHRYQKKYFSPGVLQSGTWEFNPVGSWLRTQVGGRSLGTHLGQGSSSSLHNHHRDPLACQALEHCHPPLKPGSDHMGYRKPQLHLLDGGKTLQLSQFRAMTNTDKTSFLWLTDPKSFKEPSAHNSHIDPNLISKGKLS